MTEKLKSTIKWLLIAAVSLGLMYLVFKGQDFNKLWADIKAANVYYIALALATALFSHYLRAVRWHILLKQLGYKSTNFKLFNAVIIGYIVNLALPRAGEVARCSTILRTDGVPLDKSVGTVIAERLIDLLMVFVLLLVSLIMLYDIVLPFFYSYIFEPALRILIEKWWLLLILFIVGSISIWFLFFRKKAETDSQKISKLSGIINNVKSGFAVIFTLPNKLPFIAYTIGIWLCYGLCTYLFFKSFAATAMLDFSVAIAILAGGSLGMAAPVQGGIGAFHFMVQQSLLPFGISAPDGLTYAFINHSSQTMMIIILGFLAMGVLLLINRKPQK